MVETGRGRQRRVGERAHPAGENARKGRTTGSRKGQPRRQVTVRRSAQADRWPGELGAAPGEPEPDRPPRWAARRSGRRVAKAVRSANQPGASRLESHPPRRVGGALRSEAGPATDRRESGGMDAGEQGEANPMGVSGRNTPPGSGRSNPSRSWKTAKADRSGCGSPRRGGAGGKR
jgi:hypothetical protein